MLWRKAEQYAGVGLGGAVPSPTEPRGQKRAAVPQPKQRSVIVRGTGPEGEGKSWNRVQRWVKGRLRSVTEEQGGDGVLRSSGLSRGQSDQW